MRMRLPVVATLLLAAACSHEAPVSGYSLPEGDAAGGKTAFAELKCWYCHRVQGMDFPEPRIDPPVPVELGAKWADRERTPAEFVRSIVAPSHEITPGYLKEAVQGPELSRMWTFNHIMTVQQLVDLAAFLRSINRDAMSAR